MNSQKQTSSVPSISRVKNIYPSANRVSATHPSNCARNREYLATIFKKINSGENVLSRLPTRPDPNIEFSDDDDEDETSFVSKRTPNNVKSSSSEDKAVVNEVKSVFNRENKVFAVSKSKNVFNTEKEIKSIVNKEKSTISDDKENKVIGSVMKTPHVPPNSRYLLNDKIVSMDRKFNENDKKHQNLFSKFSSASKISSSKPTYAECQRASSTSKDTSNAGMKCSLNDMLQPTFDSKQPPKPIKNDFPDISGDERKTVIPQSLSDVIQVNNKNYNVLSLIGSGGSCKVYSVFDLQDKSRVAIKRVNLKDADPAIKSGYLKEIEYLQKLQYSDRVIKMYDFECRENELFLILEHGDIDFAKYISNEAKRKRLTPIMIKFFWSQMLEAVREIHKYGIVHSDLKPANFLLVTGNLKLIDFGIATSVPEDKTSVFRDTQVGTLNYMSPEAITQMSNDHKHPLFKVGVKSDVWSLGCILYNLVYGVTPFHNFKTLVQKIYAITNQNYQIPFNPISDSLLLDVLKSCLKRNPKERASVEELLQHPYLSKDTGAAVNSVSCKPKTDLDNVVAQMQNLTPRRMRHITKVVEELSSKAFQ